MNKESFEFSKSIQSMFDQMSPKYEKLSFLASLGSIRRIRRHMADHLLHLKDGKALDLCCGSGGLTRRLETVWEDSNGEIIGLDFSSEMLELAQTEKKAITTQFILADAHNLPFRSNIFNSVTNGFGMRNVQDRDLTLAECYRVTQLGGKINILETSPPQGGLFSKMRLLYFRYVVPSFIRIFGGKKEDFEYLAFTTEGFPNPEEFKEEIESSGWSNVCFRKFLIGSVAIHEGIKK